MKTIQMHRNKIIKLLKQYQPTVKEVEFKSKILKFIEENADCFSRNLDIGHITGSSWLINKNGDKALLTHHAKLNTWLQLGGHADGDNDILRVALKEASEESGISSIKDISEEIFDIDVHQIPANKNEKAHIHYDIRFILQVSSDEKIKINHESNELLWINKNIVNLPTKEESILRMHKKWTNLKQIIS